MTGKFIAYYRVSTGKQGASGLGLEAQRKAVLDYLNGGRWKLVADFTEVESGKLSERPQLWRYRRRSPKTRLRSKNIPGLPWPIGCASAAKRRATMHTWANAVQELSPATR
jgi:hypothetical protein